ncbi:MAG: MarR family transcriptional regulator [Actinomycetia bacterium]|nr:MarR family transcriptional regulator [Actinomycetes bacterium]
MATDRTRAAKTAELADALYTVMPMVVDHVNDRLEELGMTNTDYWALRSVEGPMPMKDLAHCMAIDPSYVTLVADRLEELGLIERQPHPTDRRVKNLVLTAKGKRFKKTIPDKLWNGPNTFSTLTDNERAKLTGLLTKLVANHTPDPTAIPARPQPAM